MRCPVHPQRTKHTAARYAAVLRPSPQERGQPPLVDPAPGGYWTGPGAGDYAAPGDLPALPHAFGQNYVLWGVKSKSYIDEPCRSD
jgi:hypothetical protein